MNNCKPKKMNFYMIRFDWLKLGGSKVTGFPFLPVGRVEEAPPWRRVLHTDPGAPGPSHLGQVPRDQGLGRLLSKAMETAQNAAATPKVSFHSFEFSCYVPVPPPPTPPPPHATLWFTHVLHVQHSLQYMHLTWCCQSLVFKLT